MTLPITWAFEADMDRSGSYETDLTGYVERPGNGVSVKREIRTDGTYVVSEVNVDLSNRSGVFTPENTSSAFNGQLMPGVSCRLTATYASTTYTLWTGYIQRWRTQWRAGAVPITKTTGYDLAYYLNQAEPINVTYSASRDTDGALVAIRDAVGLASGDCDFSDGVQDLPDHYVVSQNPMGAFADVVQSEMGGHWYVSALGLLTFRARNSWIGHTADDTWGDGTTIYPQSVDFDIDPQEYVTSVRARATRFLTDQADVTMFAFSGTFRGSSAMSLAANEVWERTFSTESAYVALATPVATTDYRANDAINGSGTDRTGNLTVTLTDLGGGRFKLRLANGVAGTVYVELRVRGQRVNFYADRPEAIVSLPRPGEKAGQNADIDVPFGGGDTRKLLDLATSRAHTYRYPPARLQLGFTASNATAIVALLSVELGDLIQYTDTSLGDTSARINDLWRVTGLTYNIPPDWAGVSFMATVSLERAYQFRDLDHIAYDDFNRANAGGGLGTASCGTAWANSSGMDITSSKARANSDSAQIPNIAVGGSGDMVVEAALSNISGDADAEVGIVFRYTDSSNYWRAYVDKATSKIKLTKRVSAAETIVSQPAWTPTATTDLRVIAQGNRIRVWCAFALVIDTTDSALNTATRAGLYALNASGTVTFDDVYMEAL